MRYNETPVTTIDHLNNELEEFKEMTIKNCMPEDMPELEYDYECEKEWVDDVIDMLGEDYD